MKSSCNLAKCILVLLFGLNAYKSQSTELEKSIQNQSRTNIQFSGKSPKAELQISAFDNVISLDLTSRSFCVSSGAGIANIRFVPPPDTILTLRPNCVFRAELSAANGKFANEAQGSTSIVGNLTSSSNNPQIINLLFPLNLLAGTNYKLRVRALNPRQTGNIVDTVAGLAYTISLYNSVPAIPGQIIGSRTITGENGWTSVYTIDSSYLAASYEWNISPTVSNPQFPCFLPNCAGAIGGTDTFAIVKWNPFFTGLATIRVRSINPCGLSSDWSVLDSVVVRPGIFTYVSGIFLPGNNPEASLSFQIPAGVTIGQTNSFVVQLSNENGTFINPTNLKIINNVAPGTGLTKRTITGLVFPTGLPGSSNYRIRVLATSGVSPFVLSYPSNTITVLSPPGKPVIPFGINQLCFNNIKTGKLDVVQFRSNSGKVSLFVQNHGFLKGQKIHLLMNAPSLTSYNKVWTVTPTSLSEFTLDSSVYQGQTFNDAGKIVWNYFATSPVPDANSYEWKLSNPDLASIDNQFDIGTVLNFKNLTGNTWVKVRAKNEAGFGPWSDSLQVFVESCIKINLEPNSVWYPGIIMDKTIQGGTINLQVSKAAFTNFISSGNYRVEISDQTGSFSSPVFSKNLVGGTGNEFTGRVTGLVNGPGKILLTIPNHGLYSGANIRLNDFSNGFSFLNNFRDSITVIDSNTIRLERATLCTNNCAFSGSASFSGHDLGSPVDLRIPLPATLLPGNTYQIRVSCFQNCGNNGSSINAPLPFTIAPTPTISTPSGSASAACNVTYTYSVPEVSGASDYLWTLVPASAGNITGIGNSISITFSNQYSGPFAALTVKVKTPDGEINSPPLRIGTNCNPPIEPAFPNLLAGSYRSKATGAWKSASSWEKFDGSIWSAATTYPGDDGTTNDDPSAQYIYIGGYGTGLPPAAFNHNISLDGAINADQIVIRKEGSTTGNLTINPGATLNIVNGTDAFDALVYGNLRVIQDGNIVSSGKLAFMNLGQYRHFYTTSAGTIPQADWFPNSTCSIEGYTTNTIPPAGLNQPFQNFTWNTSGLSQTFNLKGQLSNVLGRFNNLNNNAKFLALTDNNSPIYINTFENRDRLYLNTGTSQAASNTLTLNNYINFDGDVYGSSNAAAGNLVVMGNFIIQAGTVALTGSNGSPTWMVKENASITGAGRLVGNRGGSGFSTRMDVLGDFTLNNANAKLAGSDFTDANFQLNIGGNLLFQNGFINEFNRGGNFAINVAGNFQQSGGKIDDSFVNMVLNVGGNFVQTGGTISNTNATRGRLLFGFNGTGNQDIAIIPANFNGSRVSLVLNKPSGIVNINQVFTYQDFTWLKGNLNLGGINLVGSGTLLLNGTGDLGLLSGSAGSSWAHSWLKPQSGFLKNPSDLLSITGGTGGALNKQGQAGYVTDFLRFSINSKNIAKANFTMNGSWTSLSFITLNNHGLQDGDIITIAGTTNDGGAFNGTYTITKTSANTFSLNNTNFPGTWSSVNKGSITRIDNFEVPIGNTFGYQGFAFNQLKNDTLKKEFRISYKSAGPNEAIGTKINQIGMVPDILGKNWKLERISGSGGFESLSSISVYQPSSSENIRIGQSNVSPGITGFISKGAMANGFRLNTTKDLDITAINSLSGTWFAIGSQATLAGGNYSVPGPGYQNLTDVALEFNDLGFAGPVSFTFGNTYNGRDDGPNPEKFPIVFNRKQSFPLTIKAGAANLETSNNLLSSGSNTPLLVLDGVSNISFDGKNGGGNWKFVNHAKGDSANVFRLINGAQNNVLKNMDIQASSTSKTYSGAVLLGKSSETQGNSNNQILNNKIRNNQNNKKEIFIKTIKQTLAPGFNEGGIIINATNSTPVSVRTSVKHGYSNAQQIRIRGVARDNSDLVLTMASNTSPIVITSNNHKLISGNRVFVGKDQSGNYYTGKYAANVRGNTAANGLWTVTVLSPNTFSLNGSSGNGNFVQPGLIQDSSTWSPVDPTIADNDYFIRVSSDSTFDLFKDITLTQPYTGKGRFNIKYNYMSGSDSKVSPLILSLSSTSPVVVTTSANHQLQTGQTVYIEDSIQTPVNKSQWIIKVLSPTSFSLNSSTPASFPGNPKWRFRDPNQIAVTSIPHGIVKEQILDIRGIVFPPNANGNFRVSPVNDTTLILNYTSYYHQPFFGPGTVANLVQQTSYPLVNITNSTPIKLGTWTNNWIANDTIQITGSLNGIIAPGKYRIWPGGNLAREVILLNTRRLERQFEGNPLAFLDSGMAKGVVSHNLGSSLSEGNFIKGNAFENITREGISVTNSGNGGQWKIEDNHFYFSKMPGPVSGTGKDFVAFNFIPGLKSNANIISGNNIGGSEPNCKGLPLVFGSSNNPYSLVEFLGFRISVGDAVVTKVQKNKIQNINGTGPGHLIFQNSNFSSAQALLDITPNKGILNGLNVKDGFVQIGGDSYSDGNLIGDTTNSKDFSIDINGESSLAFGLKTEASTKTIIQKNIIGNVFCRARPYSFYGVNYAGILSEGTGSHQILKNIIMRIGGYTVNGIRATASGHEQLIDSNNISRLLTGGDSMSAIYIGGSGGSGIVKRNRAYEPEVQNRFGNNYNVGMVNSALQMSAKASGNGWTVVNNQFSFNFKKWGGRYDDKLSGILHNAPSGSAPTKYFYNTVLLSGPLTDPGWSTAAFRKTGSGSLVVKNNIFYNLTGTNYSTGPNYVVAVNNTNNWNGTQFTNNLLYGNGSNPILGLFGSNPIYQLTAWEGIAGGSNNKTSTIDWLFTQPDPFGRLYLSNCNTSLAGLGVNVNQLDDFDSKEIRDLSNPDMGSQEFSRGYKAKLSVVNSSGNCSLIDSKLQAEPGFRKYIWSVFPSTAYSVQASDTNASISINWNDAFKDVAKVIVRPGHVCDTSLQSDTVYINLGPSRSTSSISACGGYNWNGSTYTNSGTFIFNTTTSAGCDSIATLNLTIQNPGDTQITGQPNSIQVLEGDTVGFQIQTNATDLIWQVNTGNGFVDLVNDGTYSGENSTRLKILSANLSLNGNQYRCIVGGNSECRDSSSIATLSVITSISAYLNGNNGLSVQPNPASKTTILKADIRFKGASYILRDSRGLQVQKGQLTGVETEMDLSRISSGVYNLRLLLPNGSTSKPIKIVVQ